MFLFEHTRSLEKGKSRLLAMMVTLHILFLGVASYLRFFYDGLPLSVFSIGSFVFVGIGFASVISIATFIRFCRGAGIWKIQISEQALIWQVPKNIGENSLILPISQIVRVCCEMDTRGESTSYRYLIETLNGEKHLLKPSFSGVNMEKFCRVLEKLGIKYETLRSP